VRLPLQRRGWYVFLPHQHDDWLVLAADAVAVVEDGANHHNKNNNDVGAVVTASALVGIPFPVLFLQQQQQQQ